MEHDRPPSGVDFFTGTPEQIAAGFRQAVANFLGTTTADDDVAQAFESVGRGNWGFILADNDEWEWPPDAGYGGPQRVLVDASQPIDAQVVSDRAFFGNTHQQQALLMSGKAFVTAGEGIHRLWQPVMGPTGQWPLFRLYYLMGHDDQRSGDMICPTAYALPPHLRLRA